MPVIVHKALTITVDEGGFLVDVEAWSETITGVLAIQKGITELAEDQLDILKFMREYNKKISSSRSSATSAGRFINLETASRKDL